MVAERQRRDIVAGDEGGQRFPPRHHRRLSHLAVLQEHCLDLAWLDPVATQLDLAVDTAEELEVAVGEVARQVAGAIDPRTGGAPNAGGGVGQETLGGEARAPQVAAR